MGDDEIDLEAEKCIYIIDKDYIIQNHQKFYPSENDRLNLFLEDSTIRIKSTKNILIKDRGLNKRSKFRNFRFYRYEPLLNQPCYQNSSNPFPTTLKDEKLLEDYYQFQKNGNKLLEKKFKLNASSEIESLKIKYIYFNKSIKYPVRFQINLRKNNEGYDLKFNTDSYSWGIEGSHQFIFKELNLHLLNNKKLTNNYKQPNPFKIISRNSWISNGLGFTREKFSWRRNYKIANISRFSLDNLTIKISGEIDFINRKDRVEQALNILIPLKSHKPPEAL